MPPFHRRRYTPTGAAVLAVLMGQENGTWSIGEIAEDAEMSYGTVYQILERYLGQGLVNRQERSTPTGRLKFYYSLTPRGRRVAERILSYMPNPVEALTAWLIQDLSLIHI